MGSDSQKGFVKFFKSSEGYGFIWHESEMGKPENLPREKGGREEIFFHVSEVRGDVNGGGKEIRLTSGDEVEFEISETDKGVMAVGVVRTKSAAEKNRSSLPATNVTIGVKKSHVPLLVACLTDISADKNASQFQPDELDAIKALLANLEHHQERLTASTGDKTHDSASNNGKASSKSKKTSKEATA